MLQAQFSRARMARPITQSLSLLGQERQLLGEMRDALRVVALANELVMSVPQ